jgi:hypothetical protein
MECCQSPVFNRITARLAAVKHRRGARVHFSSFSVHQPAFLLAATFQKGAAMRGTITAAALALMLAPVAAQAMTVNEFLAKTSALQAKGFAAMVSPDLTLLRNEIKTAATAYRAELDMAQSAHRKPRSCPPPKGQAKVDSDMLMAAFKAIPPAKRMMSVKAAFYGFMDKSYPCS